MNEQPESLAPHAYCAAASAERARRPGATACLAALVVVLAPPALLAAPADKALAICHRAAFTDDRRALELVEAGLRRATVAAAVTPNDPAAHFAVFCNLAKRMVLAAALAQRGAIAAAEREARRAVIVDRQRTPHARAAQRALLDHLCGQSWPASVAAALMSACHGAAHDHGPSPACRAERDASHHRRRGGNDRLAASTP